MSDAVPLILASGSAIRAHMLAKAGVDFAIVPAAIDEAAVKAKILQNATQIPLAGLATALAENKALNVSLRSLSALVIGSDQILAIDDNVLTKATSRDEAKQALLSLRGQTHQLHSGVVLAWDGEVVWRHVETAKLTMRTFSDAWLENYLDRAGDALTNAVGCYHLEGIGLQLFETVEGDYFTILGMPLLPLLGELRRREVIPS